MSGFDIVCNADWTGILNLVMEIRVPDENINITYRTGHSDSSSIYCSSTNIDHNFINS